MAVAAPGISQEAWAQGRRRVLAARFLLVDALGTPEGFVPFTFPAYKADPFHFDLAARLQKFERDVEEGKSPRLMIFAPPQHGKSELVSRRFPAWTLGRHPDWRIMLASYGADLAEDMSGDVRDIVRTDEFKAVFGDKFALEDPNQAVELSAERKAVSNWKIARHRGGMTATGVGGAITGRGADILIVDDPVKGREEADSETYREKAKKWWPQARDRVREGGGILVMCTRWHHQDLPGHLLTLASEYPDADQWEVLNYMAIAEDDDLLGRQPGEPLAPGRYGLQSLKTLEATVGTREWNAKWRGQPGDDKGALFLTEWWRFESLLRARPRVIYQFWDLAFARNSDNDYSVCTTWGVEPGPIYRILDVYRQRLTFPEVKKAARRLYEEWSRKYKSEWSQRHDDIWVRAVIVEKKGQTNDRYLEFKRDTRLPILWYVPNTDKVSRAHAVTPLIEGGSVILPDFAPWKDAFLYEMGRFPLGEHDDQVDAFTMALICMAIRAPGRRTPLIREFKVVA